MESSKNTNVAFSNKNYFQMELLFDLYKLISPQRKQERKINKKKNHSSQIQVDKLREEHMKNLEKLLAGVKPQYNIYQLYYLIKQNKYHLKNLKKARKKRRIDVETYDSLKIEYLQNISSIESNFKGLKILAEAYFDVMQEKNLDLFNKQKDVWKLWTASEIKFRECRRNIKELEKQRIPLINRQTFLKTRIIWEEKKQKLIKVSNYIQELIPETISLNTKHFKKSVFYNQKSPVKDILMVDENYNKIESERFEKLTESIIEHIKNKIGYSGNDFNEIINVIKNKEINHEEILGEITNDLTVSEYIKKLGFNLNLKSMERIKRFLQVIGLVHLKSKDYSSLYFDFQKLIRKSKRTTIDAIKLVIPYLEKYYNIGFNNWLPKKRRSIYTFDEIKEIIEAKDGKLISPSSQQEFFNQLNITKLSPSSLPLEIHCGNAEHPQWTVPLRLILSGHWCSFCSNKIYTFNQIKELVKDVGLEISSKEGILIKPKDIEDYEKLKERKKIIPSFLPLEVSCGISNHKSWITNAANLSGKHWCRECFKVRMSKYNFKLIKQIVERKGGKLKYPTSKNEFEIIKERGGLSPSEVPLQVICDKNHISWKTTPDNINQGHWCPYCGERYSVIGMIVHPIYEYFVLKRLLLRDCLSMKEFKLVTGKNIRVDVAIERNEAFKRNLESKQDILIFEDSIEIIGFDFTISSDLEKIIEKCLRGYQSNKRYLIIVLLRCKKSKDKDIIQDLYEKIKVKTKIKHKNRIKLMPHDEFMEFLDLNIRIDQWNYLNPKEKEIIKRSEKISRLIEEAISSDSRLTELMEESEKYKKELSRLVEKIKQIKKNQKFL